MAIYSSIIQQKFFVVPNGMLILGGAIILTFALANRGTIVLRDVITQENELLFYYFSYMLIIGVLFSPNKNGHLSQWITCLEYFFLQIVIASIIKESGTNVFHILLLAIAVVLAVVFIREPVNYENSGRLSISKEYNPNALGMAFAAGIWGVLYQWQKKKLPFILIVIFIALFGYCIMMTGSRKSLIAAGLIIVLWSLICFIPGLKGRGFIHGMTTLFSLFVLVIVISRGFISLYTDSTIAARMDTLIFETQEGNRSNMYRQGFELLKMNPLFGLGFQGFAYYFGSYSHATLVEVPVSGGIIGAILYFSAYVLSIKRVLLIYMKSKYIPELINEHIRAKMIFILWVPMLFYLICIIHPYQLNSAIMFGIIFGETAYIDNRLRVRKDEPEEPEKPEAKKIGSKYIKNV